MRTLGHVVFLLGVGFRQAWSANASCETLTQCSGCVDHQVAGSYECYWCGVDLGCHEVGAVDLPCSIPDDDSQCISKSPASSCQNASSTSCRSENGYRPEQIHLSLAGPTGMRVAWKTSADAKNCKVDAQTGSDLVEAIVYEPVQYLEGFGYHHVGLLEGLKKGATYEYWVSCAGFSSNARSFEVAPEGLESYRALVVADMGYGARSFAVGSRRLMDELKESTSLTIHAGDVGYADVAFETYDEGCSGAFCYEAVYDDYMVWIENVTDTKPYMVCPGNHEVGCHSTYCLSQPYYADALSNFTAFNARFAMPSPESHGVLNMWYSFDYGPVHFVSINTETDFPNATEATEAPHSHLPSGGFAPAGEYLRWLEADLKSANENRQATPWIVAFGHRPWLVKDVEPVNLEVELAHVPLFKRYGVDLYISGHHHGYHRYLPVEGSDEIPLVCNGGAGNPGGLDDPTLSLSGTKNGYDYLVMGTDTEIGTLDVTRTQLTFTAYKSETGEIFDVFNLTRPPLQSDIFVM
jgi:hypothetical protein